MMDQGSIRHLDQIQEQDPRVRTPPAVAAVFVALGGACLVFASMAFAGRSSKTDARPADPLGELVAAQNATPGRSTKATDLSTRDVTFPGILSDEAKPTTALAAVRGNSAAMVSAGLSPVAPATPAPPALDRLSVVPLPAQHVLDQTPVITRPRDPLTRAASDSSQAATTSSPSSAPGREGGYQLQVSSFRSQAEAAAFSEQLRVRGHKAYVAEAKVADRGTWYRVRVGPFATQQQAAAYRVSFEAKEHVVPFVVPPPGKEIAH